MEQENNYSWCSDTMEALKQEIISTHLAEIDLDSDIDIYDKIILEFVKGTLDEAFSSPACMDLSLEERKKLISEGRKFFMLCFSRGDINRWVESIDGVSLGNYELICMKIFDNFNFILEQLKKNRLIALERLKKLLDYNFGSESSVIEKLRSSFYSKKALDEVLSRFAIKDGEYSRFSDEHMSILLNSPEGVLYTFDENKEPIINNFSDIQILIKTKMREMDIDETDDNYFKRVVDELFFDYSPELYNVVFSKDVLKLLK